MKEHDLIVIGAGPGGYVAAIRAAQLGLDVACIEREAALGGTCLRVGCVPSKALLESSERYQVARSGLAEHGIEVERVGLNLAAMLERKEKLVDVSSQGVAVLFKKYKVTRYRGHARITGPGRVEVGLSPSAAEGEADTGAAVALQARHLIVATGSQSARLKGVELDYDRIGTSTEALAYPEVPEHLVVIGGGYIGLELGLVWRRLGAQVTVLEYLERVLPGTDAEIANEARRLLKRQGITFHLGSRVAGAHVDGKRCLVEREGAEPIECDRVLLAVGRLPNTEGLGLEALNIQTDRRGFIPVNEHFATAVEGVYAIGDVIGGPLLAHKAEEEALACIDHIVHGRGHVNYGAIPGVCYTEPEIASVGQTEDQLKAAGREYRKGVFHFRANARARVMGQIDGRVKVLADAGDDRILGVHIIGPHAGELIAEAVVAIEMGTTSTALGHCSHAHPTLSECVKEASLATAGQAVHA